MFIAQCNNSYHTGHYKISSERHLTRSHVGESGRGKIFKGDNFEIVLNCKEEIEKYTPQLFQHIKEMSVQKTEQRGGCM